MTAKTAGLLFLGVSVVIAILLLTRTINHITGGMIFSIALIIFGGLSRGFQKK